MYFFKIEQFTGGRALKNLDTFVTSYITDHGTPPEPTDSTQPQTVHVDHSANEEPLPPAKEDGEEDLVCNY